MPLRTSSVTTAGFRPTTPTSQRSRSSATRSPTAPPEARPRVRLRCRSSPTPIASACCSSASPPTHPAQIEPLLATVADLTAAAMSSVRRLDVALSEARRDPLTGAGNLRAFHEQLERLLGAGNRRSARSVSRSSTSTASRRSTIASVTTRETRRCAASSAARTRTCAPARRCSASAATSSRSSSPATRSPRSSSQTGSELRSRRSGEARPCPRVSAGIAAAPDYATTPSELFARADEALYAAKRAGKNRIVASGSG